MLQPRPDGTLAGDYPKTASVGCGLKRTVTFTRTGDVDVNSLPDPASQPPRVVSPAEALHGRYHDTQTFAGGYKFEYDYAVRTDCLRTGDRCVSYFHNPDSVVPLVFGAGKWTEDKDYPLPQPRQDPITLLTRHGHQTSTGSACSGGDFDEKFSRTGA
jgi:hypothetical protein